MYEAGSATLLCSPFVAAVSHTAHESRTLPIMVSVAAAGSRTDPPHPRSYVCQVRPA